MQSLERNKLPAFVLGHGARKHTEDIPLLKTEPLDIDWGLAQDQVLWTCYTRITNWNLWVGPHFHRADLSGVGGCGRRRKGYILVGVGSVRTFIPFHWEHCGLSLMVSKESGGVTWSLALSSWLWSSSLKVWKTVGQPNERKGRGRDRGWSSGCLNMATVYRDWFGEGAVQGFHEEQPTGPVCGSSSGPLLPGHGLTESKIQRLMLKM